MIALTSHEDSLEAVLLDDHVRLMDEASVTLTESELRDLIVEIAQEVQSYHEFKSSMSSDDVPAFNLTDFVATSMAQSRRAALI